MLPHANKRQIPSLPLRQKHHMPTQWATLTQSNYPFEARPPNPPPFLITRGLTQVRDRWLDTGPASSSQPVASGPAFATRCYCRRCSIRCMPKSDAPHSARALAQGPDKTPVMVGDRGGTDRQRRRAPVMRAQSNRPTGSQSVGQGAHVGAAARFCQLTTEKWAGGPQVPPRLRRHGSLEFVLWVARGHVRRLGQRSPTASICTRYSSCSSNGELLAQARETSPSHR